mgnify:FL=1
MNSWHRKHSSIKSWMLADCPDIGSSEDRPRPLPLEHIHIGKKSIHSSHQMNIFKKLIYCRTCGARAASRNAGYLKDLAKPCENPREYGIRSLALLRQGNLPAGLDIWPIDIMEYNKIAASEYDPCSRFVLRVLQDHPGLTQGEAEVVASTMLRYADHAAHSGNSSQEAKVSSISKLRIRENADISSQANEVAKTTATVGQVAISYEVASSSNSRNPIIDNVGPPVLLNAAGNEVVPYIFRPIIDSPNVIETNNNDMDTNRPPKKQRVAFNGSAMDHDDQQRYEESAVNEIDDNTSIPTNQASGSASIVPHIDPPSNISTEQPTNISADIARNRRKRRKLDRFDSNQAMNLFLHKRNTDDNSSDNDLQ